MPRFTEEAQAVQSVLIEAPVNRDNIERFGPSRRIHLDGDNPEDIYLQRTASFVSIPKFGAAACVALYGSESPDAEDPGLDQSTTEDVRRPEVDVALRVRPADLEVPEERQEAEAVTLQRGLKPSAARVVELLVPKPGKKDTFVPSGWLKGFVPTSV